MPVSRDRLISYITNAIADTPIGKSYQPKFGRYKISLNDVSDDVLCDIRREIVADRLAEHKRKLFNKRVLEATRKAGGASPDDALPLTQEAAEARRRAA